MFGAVSKHDVGTHVAQAALRDAPWNCAGLLRVSGSPSHHFPKGIAFSPTH